MAANAADWRAGVQLLKEGKTAEAVEMLTRLTSTSPDDFNAQMYLGIALAHGRRRGWRRYDRRWR